jgi:hypothetical protein
VSFGRPGSDAVLWSIYVPERGKCFRDHPVFYIPRLGGKAFVVDLLRKRLEIRGFHGALILAGQGYLPNKKCRINSTAKT